MKKTFLALVTALLAFSTTSFASQLPDTNTEVKSQYEHCLELMESGIIPLVPCYLLKDIEDAQTDEQEQEKELSEYEHCLALEAKGIIPFIPCYMIKDIEDARKKEEQAAAEAAKKTAQYESCLALEAKGIIPFIPCYLIKKIEDAKIED